jgi:hypothetical protein
MANDPITLLYYHGYNMNPLPIPNLVILTYVRHRQTCTAASTGPDRSASPFQVRNASIWASEIVYVPMETNGAASVLLSS